MLARYAADDSRIVGEARRRAGNGVTVTAALDFHDLVQGEFINLPRSRRDTWH